MKRRDLHGRLEKVEGQMPTPAHDPELEQRIAQLEELENKALERSKTKEDLMEAWRDCLRAEAYQVAKWRLQGKECNPEELHSSRWKRGEGES